MDAKNIVVDYLRHALPSTRSTDVDDAIQCYIHNSDYEARKRILSPWATEICIGTDQSGGSHKRRRLGCLQRTLDTYDSPNEVASRRPDDTVDQQPDDTVDQGPDETVNHRQHEPPQTLPEPSTSHAPEATLHEEFGELKEIAEAFFLERRQKEALEKEKPQKRPLTWTVAQKILVVLQEGNKFIEDNKSEIVKLWNVEESQRDVQISKNSSFLRRVAVLHEGISSNLHLDTIKTRLTALLIYHEWQTNKIPVANLTGTTGKRKCKRKDISKRQKTAMEWNAKPVEKTGLSFNSAGLVHRSAYGLIRFMKAWGLGGLLLLGLGQKDLFESRLTTTNAADLYHFCRKYGLPFASEADKHHDTVVSLFEEAVQKCGGNVSLLRTGGGPLTGLFRAPRKPVTPGMEISVAAADHQRLFDQQGLPKGLDTHASGLESGLPADVGQQQNGTPQYRTTDQVWEGDLPSNWPQDSTVDNVDSVPAETEAGRGVAPDPGCQEYAAGSWGLNGMMTLAPPYGGATSFPVGHDAYDGSSAELPCNFSADEWYRILGQDERFIGCFETSGDLHDATLL